MKTNDIERIVHKRPFQPFQLELDDGEEIVVKRKGKAHVSGDQIALVGICRMPNGHGFEKFRLVRVDRVRSVKTVSNADFF